MGRATFGRNDEEGFIRSFQPWWASSSVSMATSIELARIVGAGPFDRKGFRYFPGFDRFAGVIEEDDRDVFRLERRSCRLRPSVASLANWALSLIPRFSVIFVYFIRPGNLSNELIIPASIYSWTSTSTVSPRTLLEVGNHLTADLDQKSSRIAEA